MPDKLALRLAGPQSFRESYIPSAMKGRTLSKYQSAAVSWQPSTLDGLSIRRRRTEF